VGCTAALGRTARVEDLKAILLLVQGKVAVAEDDGIGGREALTQARQPALGGAGIVGYRDRLAADLDLELRREYAPQGGLVDIAMHGVDDGTEGLQFRQYRGGREVAGVDDRLGGGQELDAALRQPAGALRHVRVGEDGDQTGAGLCSVKASW
jgi:hypothetical protein